jgi:MFS family permease
VLSWSAYAHFFREPRLADALFRFSLFALAFSTFVSGFPLFAERRFTHNGLAFGPKEVGYVYAYAGFLGILIQGGLIGRLVKRLGEDRLATVGFLSAAIGYTLLGASRDVPTLLLAATFSSFGTGVLRPCLTSLASQRADRREQGAVLGLTQSLNSLATIFAPLMSGLFIEHGYLRLWAWFAALITVIGFVVGARQKRIA